jgi:hypothetical protein
MSTPESYPHIEKRSDDKLWLTGTQTKVIEVALDRIAHHYAQPRRIPTLLLIAGH